MIVITCKVMLMEKVIRPIFCQCVWNICFCYLTEVPFMVFFCPALSVILLWSRYVTARCKYLEYYFTVSELSDTQKDLQELARKFSREEIVPKAADYDRSMKFPWDIIKKAWELGLTNYHIPQHCGELYWYAFHSVFICQNTTFFKITL